ncbi:MAG TPA: STN domain-containing protein, partial [Chryseolinea sp.]|nr:STN domain-containing protein [Chryseolinea sp.]
MSHSLNTTRAWSIAFVIVLIMIATPHPFTYGETPVLERTITLTLNRERIDIALKKVAQQGDFTFSYSPAIVDVSKIVTFTFAGNTVREVLDQLFQGTVHYKTRGNYIILTKAATTSDAQTYSGYIIDETTGTRLKNVSVYDPVSLSSAVTDDYGYFQLKIDKPTAEDVQLAIEKLNYIDTMISVSSSKKRLLNIPISVNQDKLASLADSVSEKIRRFWKTKVLAPQSANIENIRDTLHRTTQVSVVPFVGTNHSLSGNIVNDYSFNIFGGYALGVEKLEVGTFFNIDRADVKG